MLRDHALKPREHAARRHRWNHRVGTEPGGTESCPFDPCPGQYGLAEEEEDELLMGLAGPRLADTEGAGRVRLRLD
jgi:hypothetical protein